jgi:branched-chain amino acid transport system permease protein
MSPGQTSLAMTTMVYGIVGLSLLVLTGWAGQISLGQVAFAAIGGWTAAAIGWPFPFALLAGSVAGALFAVAVGIPALRLRGLYLAMTTLALAGATSALLLDQHYLGRFVTGDVARPVLLGINFDDDRAFYYLILVITAGAIIATLGMRRHRTARALIACRDNDRAAASFGIDLVRGRLGAFAISGAMAAAAGVILVYVQRGFQPQTFAADRSIDLFLMTVIGGLGSISGPMIGALYLGALSLLESTPIGSLAQLLLSPGLGVVLLLIMAPGGLSKLIADMRDAWLRRVASRYRVEVPSLVGEGGDDDVVTLSPKQREGSAAAFVPVRYRPSRGWRAGAVTGGAPGE